MKKILVKKMGKRHSNITANKRRAISYTKNLLPKNLSLLTSYSLLLTSYFSSPVQAEGKFYEITVNSNQDTIQADEALTLREAIAITNSTLSVEKLSQEEEKQVKAVREQSQIKFNLPAEHTVIELEEILPPLASKGLTIDGTSQPGYEPNQSATAEISIPIPVVEITAAKEKEVLRGLTIVADDITIKGLSIYGFTSLHGATASTPPADIFLVAKDQTLDWDIFKPPHNTVIENNWLGMPPNERMPEVTSAFGVSVFNATGTTIRRNRISHHDGSGIITSQQAADMEVSENIIVGNGIAGMPDGIRLEGHIHNADINSNLLCGNDGSGIFMFKPEGAVTIRENKIKHNGRRLRRAAVYLMGNDHQVTNNSIISQLGPGVVVAAYPQSNRNLIQNNYFSSLEGLSIDLATRNSTTRQDYQRGDGPNPQRDTSKRNLDTGNRGINTPQWLSKEFFLIDGKVNLDGTADPGSQIEVYQVMETENTRGPLNKNIATVTADDKGKFALTLTNQPPGTKISAIATHPDYGTSEPALNVVISSLDSSGNGTTDELPPEIPLCTTAPDVVVSVPPPEEPVKISIPTVIHFALDRSNISPESATVIKQIAAVMKEYPFLTVDIQGHTDTRASNEYNQALGMRRARAARNYLLRQGIAPERLTIRSFGEAQLKLPGRENLDHARNRRVEFTFYDIRGLDIIFTEQENDLQIED